MKPIYNVLFAACMDFKMAAPIGQASGRIDNWFYNYSETTDRIIEDEPLIFNLDCVIRDMLVDIEENETQEKLDNLSKIADLMIELIKAI